MARKEKLDNISTYSNYGLLRKNRIIKFKQQKSKCEICKKKAHHIHHLDKSTNNHDLDNLIVVCAKCHYHKFHKPNLNKGGGIK